MRRPEEVHAALPESSQRSCRIGRATQDAVGVTFCKEVSTFFFCLACNTAPIHCAIFGQPGSLGDDILLPPNQGTSWVFSSALKMAPTFSAFLRLNDLPQNYLDAKPVRQVLRKVTVPSASVPPYLMFPVTIPKTQVTGMQTPSIPGPNPVPGL